MTSKRRCCHNDQDVFCYICGEYMKKEHRFNVRDFTKVPTQRALASSWEIRISLGLPIKCAKIALKLFSFGPKERKVKAMRFGVLMVWREPINHHDNCYFCLVDMTGLNSYKKKTWFILT